MSQKKKDDTYNFFTMLCASKKIMIKGDKKKSYMGTGKVFNAYKKSEYACDLCKKKHYEVFQEKKDMTIKAFGMTCTFEQGTANVDRFMIFDKIPKGLDIK